jgi:hypothetical protein
MFDQEDYHHHDGHSRHYKSDQDFLASLRDTAAARRTNEIGTY